MISVAALTFYRFNSKKQRRARRTQGNTIVELPFVIWGVLLVLFFPLINYATIGIRSAFVFNACQIAALTASKARSYDTSTASDPSAKQLALNTATLALSTCDGVKLNSVKTEILTTKISDKTKSAQEGKLSAPPNTAVNTYQLQVTVNTDINPLIMVDSQFFGNIPGISAAYNLKVTQRHFVENSQGLMR